MDSRTTERGVAAETLLRARDWTDVARRYQGEPLGYVVIDDLLLDEVCSELHETLLGHWGWRHKDWTSLHLRNTRLASVHVIRGIAEELKDAVPDVFGGWELANYWALLYPKSGAGRPHFDPIGLNVTYWLTPDRYNRRPGSGGLVLYSSSGDYRPQVLELADGVAPDHPEPDGPKVIIPHRRNRAVVFSATTLHRTGEVDFDDSDPHGHRMNLTLAFDRATHAARR